MRSTLASVALLTSAICAIARGEDWPGFRGPTGQGVSSETGVPLRWSATENVAWKTALPGQGWSSPIVVGDRIFVTLADDGGASCRVVCLAKSSGEILWNQEVFRQELRRKEGKNSYATPTPTSDGVRVYAVFGGGGIAAVSLDGKLAWKNQDVKFYSRHGLGASPILAGELLIMPFDGSSDGADEGIGWKTPWEKALVLALDRATGKVRWRSGRGASRIAHVTPRVLEEGARRQLVSGAGDVIQGFDLASGERLWSIYSQGEGVVPSIVLGDTLAYSVSGFEKPTIRAVRTDGKGEVTGSHIAWEQTEGVPSQSSLLYIKPKLYAVTDGGVVTCYDAATGAVAWKHRIGGSHSASPVYADGRIYFLSEQGESVVIKPGDRYEELARNSIGERCQASMAISDSRLFIRGEKHLYCIGEKN